MSRGVRTLPTSRSVRYAGLLRKTPAFWEQEATIYHQENAVGGNAGWEWGTVAQAVLEPAGRVELIWMESLLCHLPSAHSHGRPGGRPGPGPTLQATMPGACHTQTGLTTDVGSKVREEFPFAGGSRLAGSAEGKGIPELPVTSQPFSPSHSPRWPRGPGLLAHTSPGATAAKVGLF